MHQRTKKRNQRKLEATIATHHKKATLQDVALYFYQLRYDTCWYPILIEFHLLVNNLLTFLTQHSLVYHHTFYERYSIEFILFTCLFLSRHAIYAARNETNFGMFYLVIVLLFSIRLWPCLLLTLCSLAVYVIQARFPRQIHIFDPIHVFFDASAMKWLLNQNPDLVFNQSLCYQLAWCNGFHNLLIRSCQSMAMQNKDEVLPWIYFFSFGTLILTLYQVVYYSWDNVFLLLACHSFYLVSQLYRKNHPLNRYRYDVKSTGKID